MIKNIKKHIDEFGYIFLQENFLNVSAYEIACKFGRPITPWQGGATQRLIPRAESTPNTYSGIYGLNRFPFHTDLAHWRLPPRYLLLHCVKGYPDIQTFLIDGRVVTKAITLDIMTRAIVKPRRPQNNAIPLLRLCEQVENSHRLRWDETFLRPASKIGEAASQQVKAFLSTASALSIALVREGDLLIIDNWRMLHARSPVSAVQKDRIIERVYLEVLN